MSDRTVSPGRTASTGHTIIRTPDHRLRVFVGSTLQELAEERQTTRDLYRAYLDQSHIFIGIYWQRYGWIAP